MCQQHQGPSKGHFNPLGHQAGRVWVGQPEMQQNPSTQWQGMLEAVDNFLCSCGTQGPWRAVTFGHFAG